ncbi:membrane protein [Streptomyces showdoensis]|uniref:Membrane protein n=1 Tax=Streptomyces showdoensis TaxID=68268 RepID=A0A2P2GHV0_STREW|nr:membrane protein [Streptomyces showdoensis]
MGKRVASRSRPRNGRGVRLPVLLLVLVSLCGGVALARYGGERGSRTGSAAPGAGTATGRATAAPPPATVRPGPTRTPEAASGKRSVPRSGTGTFTVARASGAAVGSGGSLRRYRVEVEDGVAVSARAAAAEIQRILAHPRGWAAHGRGRFQLVSEDADFVIRIATPDTADRLCRENGMDTHGELNCETTAGVVVNLRRWVLGSPTFAGEAAEYRHLIINHEVGHEIGLRNHLGCPGPGRPAPVMMQQIKGLNGCRSNAFPYDEEGIYISGPIVS